MFSESDGGGGAEEAGGAVERRTDRDRRLGPQMALFERARGKRTEAAAPADSINVLQKSGDGQKAF